MVRLAARDNDEALHGPKLERNISILHGNSGAVGSSVRLHSARRILCISYTRGCVVVLE